VERESGADLLRRLAKGRAWLKVVEWPSSGAVLQLPAACRQKTHRSHVEVAHMELARPSIADAVAKCAAAGAKRVVVAPYFLSRGRHITEDIPALVASAQAEHPGVECIVADPIGETRPLPHLPVLRWRVLLACKHSHLARTRAACPSALAKFTLFGCSVLLVTVSDCVVHQL